VGGAGASAAPVIAEMKAPTPKPRSTDEQVVVSAS